MSRLVFDQSSPDHPVSESRGGTLSVTKDGRKSLFLILYKLYIIHCTLYTVHCTLYTIYYILYIHCPREIVWFLPQTACMQVGRREVGESRGMTKYNDKYKNIYKTKTMDKDDDINRD